MGLRKRNRRRVGIGRRRRGRRGGGGRALGGLIALCICGVSAAVKTYKRNVKKVETEQHKFLEQKMVRKAKRKEGRKARREQRSENRQEEGTENKEEKREERAEKREERREERAEKREKRREERAENRAKAEESDTDTDDDEHDDDEQKVLKAAERERAKQIQEDQVKVLNEIMQKIKEEDDPDKLELLIEQQNRLIETMKTFEAEGYKYDGGIPEVATAVDSESEETPGAAKY